MPLNKSALQQKLRSFGDPFFTEFISYPTNVSDLANKWGDALDLFIPGIIPTTTTALAAKEAFKVSMNTGVGPIPNKPYYEPFTLGFFSQESALLFFNQYLLRIGYTPNPELDTNAQIAITNSILLTYNKLYPNNKLTVDGIYYNQARYNMINADGIANGTIKPLSTNLSGDGIIGDDTIKYMPTTIANPFQDFNSPEFISTFDGQVIAQPSVSGNLSFNKYSGHTPNFIDRSSVYYQYIKTNKIKNYLLLPLTKTQSDIGEKDYMDIPNNPNPSKPMSFYINSFESNHKLCDPSWKTLHINNITELNTVMRLAQTIHNLVPQSKKDFLVVLADSLKIYATQIAIGMQPSFTAAPPAMPINFIPVKTLGLNGGTTESCIEILSTIILNWFKTGLATNNGSGVTTNWN